MSDFYQVLNVSRDAEDVVIESAYRALMKRYHPDKTNGDPASAERAKLINEAYSTLKDPESRARYDRSLGVQSTGTRAGTAQQAQRANETSRDAAPPAQRQGARPEAAGRADLTSLFFIGLALLIGVGALGSLMGIGAGAPADPATVEAEAEVASGVGEPLGAAGGGSPGDRPGRNAQRQLPKAGGEDAAVVVGQAGEGAAEEGAKDQESRVAPGSSPPSPEQVLDDVEGLY